MSLVDLNFFDKINSNKAIKNLNLMVEIDKCKHKKIYVTDGVNKVYLKGFCGDFDYRKFMVEAVLLHLMADKKSIKRVNEAYRKLYRSFLDFKLDVKLD